MIQRNEQSPPGDDVSSSPEARPSDGSYLVELEEFAGPLDLLLYLIQRDEIDIYDIPIAHITHQYLEYLELLDVFNLDNAGEFLVMAATLMRIKARMLLPIQRPDDDEEEGVDPRDELVRRLLEYKKYKEASEQLADFEGQRRQFFGRGQGYSFSNEDTEPPELSLSMFDLLRAVKRVLEQMQGEHVHHVYKQVYTVESQRGLVLRRLETQPRLSFSEVFEGMRVKMEVVVTFIAVLDLLKQRRIRVHQVRSYGDLWIEPGVHYGEPEEPQKDGSQEATDEA